MLARTRTIRWSSRGPAASGKSTLAAELAERSGLPVVSSDAIRKRLAGLAPAERARARALHGVHAATYAALGERGADRLRGGEGAARCDVRDTRGSRRAAGSDRGRARGVLFVHCRVPRTARSRGQPRMGDPERISDATPEIVARLFETYEPTAELPTDTVLEIDGRAPLERQADRASCAGPALDERRAAAPLSSSPRPSAGFLGWCDAPEGRSFWVMTAEAHSRQKLRVVVVGGGVAALETALALRELRRGTPCR